MTCMQLNLPLPSAGPALLTLPQPLRTQALLELEHAVVGTLRMLRRDLLSVDLGFAPEPAVHQPDAAEIEYASWMADPGAIEVASWAAHMRTSRR